MTTGGQARGNHSDFTIKGCSQHMPEMQLKYTDVLFKTQSRAEY